MFYNKALFAEAGIDDLPTTWDEWVATAAELTIDENGDGTPEQYGLALQDHVTVGNGVWPTLFKSGGGDIVDDSGNAVIDSPENLATLEYWHDAVANQHISPGGLDGVGADELYGAGKAAMTFGGPWLASISTEQGIDYGIAPVPTGPAGIQQSALAVTMGVTSQASEEQRAGAEAFFTWFFAKDNMITWSLGSGWPPLTTDVTAADVAENPVVSALTEQAPNGAALLPGVVASTDILTAMDSLTQQAMAGGDISTLLEEAQAEMDSILAK
jgi:multiple sugar transport system substrate-binding protein